MNNPEALKMVIIDDHPLLRKGLQQLAELSPDIEIIAEANNGETGLALIRDLNPDLVLLDLNMPGKSGLTILGEIKQLDPEIRVVIFTVSNAEEDVVAAMRMGADGYLLKDMDPAEMLVKFHEVAEGKMIMSSTITDCLVRALHAEGRRDQLKGAVNDLTEREKEILVHLREGESNKMIARLLDITEATVKVHVKHLLKKLNLKTRVEAAVWAVTNKHLL